MELKKLGDVLGFILTGVVVICAAGLAMPHAGGPDFSFPFQKTASIGFVLVGVVFGALRTWYGRFVLLGLLFCLGGDYFGVGHRFVLSLSSFLLGHLAYVAAFALHGISGRRILAMLPIALLAVAAIVPWLFPHVPAAERVPVIAYVTVITSMLITAGGSSTGSTGKLIITAAVLFFVSDIFVARWKYVSTESINGLFCYPLYYAACLCYGWTIFLDLRERKSVAPRAKS